MAMVHQALFPLLDLTIYVQVVVKKKGCLRAMSHQPSEEQHGSSVPVSPAKYSKEGSSKPFIWVWARMGDCHLIPGLDFCSEEGLLIFLEFM